MPSLSQDPYGIPLRWTSSWQDNDLYSELNDSFEEKLDHVWELVADMDCSATAGGYFRFTSHMLNEYSGDDVYETGFEQGVCDGGVDQGVPFDTADSKVHYGL